MNRSAIFGERLVLWSFIGCEGRGRNDDRRRLTDISDFFPFHFLAARHATPARRAHSSSVSSANDSSASTARRGIYLWDYLDARNLN